MESIREDAPVVELEMSKMVSGDEQKSLSASIASTVSEPIKSPPGPYLQMVYYAVSGFFFWAILMIQLPMIDKYFGGPDVVFFIIFAYGLASNVIRVYLLWYGSRTKKSQAVQMRNLIVYGAGLISVTMLAYPISMALIGTDNPQLGFWMGIILSSFMGLWVSLLMNAGFNLMSLAPEKSASFFLLGQTATGIVTWPLLILLRFAVSKAGAGENTDLYVAAISFSLAAAIVAGCIPLYLMKTRHHSVFSAILVDKPRTSIEEGTAGRVLTPPVTRDTIKTVFAAIMTPAICAWMCSAISFSVFPSQVSRWFPHSEGSYQTEIYRSFLIYTFSIADTIGRALPRFVPLLLRLSDKAFWIITSTRGLVFIPLFLMASKRTAELFTYDWFRLVLILVFGVSNGANFSSVNMVAPRRIQMSDKIHAGTILSLMAVNGVFVGTLIGIGFKYI
jgi:hypothetical protein